MTMLPTESPAPMATNFATPVVQSSAAELPAVVDAALALPAFSAPQVVLESGPAGAWDAGGVREAFVLAHQGLLCLFYTGFADSENQSSAIGFATSMDGLVWEKHPDNPILTASESGFDAQRVYWPSVTAAEEGWRLYYAGTPDSETRNALEIGLAQAERPERPWARAAAPVLETGAVDQWDSLSMAPGPVIHFEDGYRMCFSAFGSRGAFIGMARSDDALSWQKYDDPASTTIAFSASDPVFGGESSSWDRIVWGASMLPVLKDSSSGWALFYHGDALSSSQAPALGQAFSMAGLDWLRPFAEPIVRHPGDRFPQAPSALIVDGRLHLYYTPIDRAPAQTQIVLVVQQAGE